MFKLIHAQNNLWYGQFSIFPQDKVIHAISTRFNGHSKAPFDGLNLALHVMIIQMMSSLIANYFVKV